MINKIIEEIDKSLESEAYLSALSLVLILPDICGKAEYIFQYIHQTKNAISIGLMNILENMNNLLLKFLITRI